MTKVYISSTYCDLKEHRKLVSETLRKLHFDVIAMEDYVACDERPLDKCLADVAACDIYIGIFAWRYGHIPPGQKQSITELEFRQAVTSNLTTLIFLLDKIAPWPRSQMDKGIGEKKLEALRKKLSTKYIVSFFESAEQLATLVSIAVSMLADERLSGDMQSKRERREQADRQRRDMRRQRVVNLCPINVTDTFKDRAREIEHLLKYLADGGVRLISVVGLGGMGKTALVSCVLADLEQGILPIPGTDETQIIDGILYLGTHTTGISLERIYRDVAYMLGEPHAGNLAACWADPEISLADKVQRLLVAVQSGLYIILLDNLEDLLDEECAIAEEGLRLFVECCLIQPSGAQLVVTSREAIKLTASVLGRTRRLPLREGLPEDDAIALLRELDPDGETGLRDAPEELLRQAARLTCGIPCALQSVSGILHEDPTATLVGLVANEALFGEKVAEHWMNESFQRLASEKRRVMEALAVFSRPVEAVAVSYLLHPWAPGLDTATCLRQLIRSYFVDYNRVTSTYSLHPIHRKYAYRQIPDPSDENEETNTYNTRNLELRAADFYGNLRKPESEWNSIEDLAPQLAEFEHRVRAEDYNVACQLLDQIDYDYLFQWGSYTRLKAMREQLLGHLTRPNLQTNNLGRLGGVCHHLGQTERALEFYERGLTTAQEIGDRRSTGIYLGGMGSVYRDLWQTETATGYLHQALIIAREFDDYWRESWCLTSLGSTYKDIGLIEEGIEALDQALTIARKIVDRRLEERILDRLGGAYLSLGQFEIALDYSQEALNIARALGDRSGESYRLKTLGKVYFAQGKYGDCIKCQQEGRAIANDTYAKLPWSLCSLWLGKALLATGMLAEARKYCQEALAMEVPLSSCRAALSLGIILLHQRDLAARDSFADAIALCRACLDRTPNLYDLRYELGTALVGQAVCDPRWAEERERTDLLAQSLAEYQQALGICAAPGHIHLTLHNLEMIQSTTIEGLEPAFVKLSSGGKTPQRPE